MKKVLIKVICGEKFYLQSYMINPLSKLVEFQQWHNKLKKAIVFDTYYITESMRDLAMQTNSKFKTIN